MKVAFITGASGGIGAAVATCFAQQGFALALQYRSNRDALLKTVRSFPNGTKYLLIETDLTDESSILSAVRDVHTRLGTVSVLVNCAGTALKQSLFADTDTSDYERVFSVNVRGTMTLSRFLLDDLRHNEGSIVNISSVWGITGGSCEVVYSASKAAIHGFTKALAKELAPSGVRVNCVAPGFIPTAMNAHLDAETVEAIRLETPLLRLGSPRDVAECVYFLSTQPFLTGTILPCDGGLTI